MLDYDQIEKAKAKQILTGSLATIRIDDDEVLYRGKTIRKHFDVPNGYGGKYSVKAKHSDGKIYTKSFAKLSDAKKYIDGVI